MLFFLLALVYLVCTIFDCVHTDAMAEAYGLEGELNPIVRKVGAWFGPRAGIFSGVVVPSAVFLTICTAADLKTLLALATGVKLFLFWKQVNFPLSAGGKR